MKWIIGAFLVCAMAASPLLARQEPDDEEKPKQEEPKKQPPSQEKTKTNSGKQQTEPTKQQKAEEKQQQKEQKDAQKSKESEKSKNKDADKTPQDNHQAAGNTQQTDRGQRSAQESSGQGQRIPPEKFQASFGREHHFRVQHLDDRHRFQYGGYWFEVAQPWPTGWSYSDDCYIEDDGGSYYLVDLVHPDIHVLVIVVEA
jgi:hypothetical protein